MNVLLISECEKKAWKSTRRIVSQYLPQHGSRVWMGSIDKEGLQELHKELKRKVTKNNAII
jgi:CRISPR-associated endonuclease/helicase Cas3